MKRLLAVMLLFSSCSTVPAYTKGQKPKYQPGDCVSLILGYEYKGPGVYESEFQVVALSDDKQYYFVRPLKEDLGDATAEYRYKDNPLMWMYAAQLDGWNQSSVSWPYVEALNKVHCNRHPELENK